MPQEENSSIVGIVAIIAILVIIGAIIFIVYRKTERLPSEEPGIEINLPPPNNSGQP